MKIITRKGGKKLIKIGKKEKNFVKKMEILERFLQKNYFCIETKNEFICKTRDDPRVLEVWEILEIYFLNDLYVYRKSKNIIK